MDKKKTIACSCSNIIDVSDRELFSKVTCTKCNTEFPVCGFIGNFIFEEKLSENNYYSTFKGFKDSDLDEKLVIKLISDDCNFTGKNLSGVNKSLNSLPDKMRLISHEVEGKFLFVRKFYETSLKDYLNSSRPRSSKAIVMLQESAEILNDCTKKGAIPVSLPIGNLLMDENGNTVLSDLLFREAFTKAKECRNELITKEWSLAHYIADGKATLAASIYSFGRLAKYLCCGSLIGEIKLDLRDGEPSGLKILIDKTLNEPKSFNSFKDVMTKLAEILNSSVVKEVIAKKNDKTIKPQKQNKASNKVTAKKAVTIKGNAKADAVNKLSAKPCTVKLDNAKTVVSFGNTSKSPSPKPRKRRAKSNNTPILVAAVVGLVALIIIIAIASSVPEANSGQAYVESIDVLQKKKKKVPALTQNIDKVTVKNNKITVTPILRFDERPKKYQFHIKEFKTNLSMSNSLFASIKQYNFESTKEDKETYINIVKLRHNLRPKDLNFSGLDNEINIYINTLNESTRKIEALRLRYMKAMRGVLIECIKKDKYNGIILSVKKQLKPRFPLTTMVASV